MLVVILSVNSSKTYIIMESLGLTAVVACLSPLWGGAVEVPEHADKTEHVRHQTDWLRLTTTRSGGTLEARPALCSSPSGSRNITSMRHLTWPGSELSWECSPDWINNCPMRKENQDFPPIRTRCGGDANCCNLFYHSEHFIKIDLYSSCLSERKAWQLLCLKCFSRLTGLQGVKWLFISKGSKSGEVYCSVIAVRVIK